MSDELHRTLKTSAAAECMSLSDYIKRELGTVATYASFEEIDARIRARGPTGLRTEDIIADLRELRGD